jgi:hypothetical protein
MNKLLVVITLSSFFTYAYADDSINKKQPDSELTILGVTLGKTTLNQVKEKFKINEIYHEGDADTSLYAICLKSANGQTIAFESNEAGVAEPIVNSLSVNSSQSPYHLSKICEKTSIIKGKLTLYKTSLGMSPDIIKRLTGKPTKQSSDTIEYRYENKEKSEKGVVDIISNLIVEFKNSMSIQFTASKHETNQ